MDAIYNHFREDSVADNGENEMNDIDEFDQFDVSEDVEEARAELESDLDESVGYDEAEEYDDNSETIMFENVLSDEEPEQQNDEDEPVAGGVEEKPLIAIARPFQLLCDSRIKGLDILPPEDGYLPRGYLQQEYKKGMKLYDNPGMIVDNRSPWIMRLQWRVAGTTASVMTGTWDVTIRLFRMCGTKRLFNIVGQQEEGWLDVARESVEHLRVDLHDYDQSIEVPAGLVPNGYYRLHTFVDLRLPDGKEAPVCAVGVSQIVRFVGG